MEEDKLTDMLGDVAKLKDKCDSNTHAINEVKSRMDKQDDKIEQLNQHAIAIGRITVVMENMQKNANEQQQITKEITSTLNDISTTLSKTNLKLDATNGKVNELDKKIDEVNNRVETEEEGHKIDFIKLVKDNILAILGLGGVIYTIIMNMVK